MVVTSQKEHLTANGNEGEQSSTSKQKAVNNYWTGLYLLNLVYDPGVPSLAGVLEAEYLRTHTNAPISCLQTEKVILMSQPIKLLLLTILQLDSL